MAYVAPRIVIVLIGWGLTCAWIAHAHQHLDLRMFCITGLPWMLGGTLVFRSLYRWRREEHDRNLRALAIGARPRPRPAAPSGARSDAVAGGGQALPA
jgi:hypothetical protein